MDTKKYFVGVANEMLSKLHRLNYFTGHAAAIGAYHEAILRSAIQQILPESFTVRTGFVFAKSGQVSRQIDLMIVDEIEANSYFFQEGDFAVIHPDSLVAAIEVKTNLNFKDFRLASENCFKLGQLRESAREGRKAFLSFVFSFEGAKLTNRTLENWFSRVVCPYEQSKAVNYYPMSISSLENGILQLYPKDEQQPAGYQFMRPIDEEAIAADTFAIFLLSVRKACLQSRGVGDINPFEFAEDRDFRIEDIRYLYKH